MGNNRARRISNLNTRSIWAGISEQTSGAALLLLGKRNSQRASTPALVSEKQHPANSPNISVDLAPLRPEHRKGYWLSAHAAQHLPQNPSKVDTGRSPSGGPSRCIPPPELRFHKQTLINDRWPPEEVIISLQRCMMNKPGTPCTGDGQRTPSSLATHCVPTPTWKIKCQVNMQRHNGSRGPYERW